MVSRGHAWLGPPLAALALVGGVLTPRGTDAAAASLDLPTCPHPAATGPGADAAYAWFRLDPVVDEDGWLVGQQLEIGSDKLAARQMALDSESFARGPVDGRIVVGSDDGKRSKVRVVDAVLGCELQLGTRHDVVRSAVLATDGSRAFEHRVDRRTRADLGVWVLSLPDGRDRQVLRGIAADERYGPTFTTTILAGTAGELAAVACGATSCRARVIGFDSDSGAGTGSDGPLELDDVGDPIGLFRGDLVAYGACPGLPCPIERLDAAGGRTVLAEGAGLATLAGVDSDVLVHEEWRDNGLALVALDLTSGHRRALPALPTGLRLLPGSHRALAGLERSDEAVVLAPDGRVERSTPSLELLDIRDGHAIALAEAS